MVNMMDVFNCQGFLMKVAFCLAAIILTSHGQAQTPLSYYCQYLDQSTQMTDSCVKISGSYSSSKVSGVKDNAVLGYLCCLGMFCGDNQKNYLAYANLEYIKHLAAQIDSSVLNHAAKHLKECGWQADPRSDLTKKSYGKKICHRRASDYNDPKSFTTDDLLEYIRSGSRNCRAPSV